MSPLPPGLVRLGMALPEAVHAEAVLLTRCVAARLPVPVGAVVLAGCDDLGSLTAGDAVSLRVLGARPAVRVATDRPAVLAAALRTARLATPAGARQDVLLLRATASVHAGRVTTGGLTTGSVTTDSVTTSGGHDAVRAVEGEAHELDASTEVRDLLLPRLGHRWQRAHRGVDPWRTPLPPWGMRLSRLLRDVRRVLGHAPLELTWADDGHTCRLLGVRPCGGQAG